MNPELYHLHHELRSEDVPFWLSMAQEIGGPILELGCGTGRILKPLVEAGHEVGGRRQRPEMLAFMHQNLGPGFARSLLCLEADIRAFDLKTSFPFVIFPCNTFSNFSRADRLKILQVVNAHMTEDGVFLVSMPNPAMLMTLPPKGEPDLEETFPHPRTGNSVQVMSSWERTDDR